MTREWEPGDVATYATELAFFTDDDVWVWARTGCACLDQGGIHANARPLVVIDPEDREQVERVWQAWRDHAPDHRLAQDNLQAALRSLIAPPKPPEPTGLGAVVEDEGGVRWVRNPYAGAPEWDPTEQPIGPRRYADITAVRVLNEGVDQ